MSSLEEKGKIPRPDEHENGKLKFVSNNPNAVECPLTQTRVATSFTTHHMLLRKVVVMLCLHYLTLELERSIHEILIL